MVEPGQLGSREQPALSSLVPDASRPRSRPGARPLCVRGSGIGRVGYPRERRSGVPCCDANAGPPRPPRPPGRERLPRPRGGGSSYRAARGAPPRHIARAGGDVDAQLALAELRLRSGDAEGALRELEVTTALSPSAHRARVLRAQAFLALRRPEDALAELDRYVRQTGGDAPSHTLRASVLESLERWEPALADGEAALETESTVDLHLARARLLAARGEDARDGSASATSRPARRADHEILQHFGGATGALGAASRRRGARSH
ncbi:MAG: tetratricopeptide repeat protein, partial [Sandaracinaceae bacterium]